MNPRPDVREVVSTGRMMPRQTAAVAVAILLNVVDGFDVLVMAFTSSSVSDDFQLGPGGLGLLLSASLFGMAIGSIALAPVADRVGRRPVTLAALATVTVLMAASALAPSAAVLGVLRFATGLGIGAMLPNLSTFVSEFATRKWREPLVTLNSLGYALGGTVGGLIAAPLIASSGWRAAFWLGAGFGLVGFIATYVFVPESIHYLVVRRPADALARVNRVLARMGRPAVDVLPETAHESRARLADMFRGDLRRTTVMVWISFFCVMAAFYFANSWTPKLLEDAGLSEQQGIFGGILISFGGVLGALVFALVAIRIPAKYVEAGALVGGSGLFVVFALVLSLPVPAMIAAGLVGFFINATVAGMYAVVSTRYPSEIRGAGVGWAVGMGRIGAILAPTLAGWLMATGLGPRDLYFVFIVPMLVGAVAVLSVGRPAPETGRVTRATEERIAT